MLVDNKKRKIMSFILAVFVGIVLVLSVGIFNSLVDMAPFSDAAIVYLIIDGMVVVVAISGFIISVSHFYSIPDSPAPTARVVTG